MYGLSNLDVSRNNADYRGLNSKNFYESFDGVNNKFEKLNVEYYKQDGFKKVQQAQQQLLRPYSPNVLGQEQQRLRKHRKLDSQSQSSLPAVKEKGGAGTNSQTTLSSHPHQERPSQHPLNYDNIIGFRRDSR